MKVFFVLSILLFYCSTEIKAQVLPKSDTTKALAQKDTLKRDSSVILKPKRHSALKATLFSTALPGLGQIYNGKWWKAPIVWAVVGGMCYLMIDNSAYYSKLRRNYLAMVDNDPNTVVDPQYSNIDPSVMKAARDQARSNFELSAVGFSLVYLLNIMDAFVDGHLHDFNVSEDLSMKVKPTMIRDYSSFSTITPGIGISFSFKSNKK